MISQFFNLSQVAQKCKLEPETTPHEVLGFRDPPAALPDYKEHNVSHWVQEHYGANNLYENIYRDDAPPSPANSSTTQGARSRRPPPPPPKRSETTQLSRHWCCVVCWYIKWKAQARRCLFYIEDSFDFVWVIYISEFNFELVFLIYISNHILPLVSLHFYWLYVIWIINLCHFLNNIWNRMTKNWYVNIVFNNISFILIN